MPVLVIGELPGGDAALDARMMQELGLQNAPAPGAIARFAGPTANGWRVISVWESEDAYRSFERERVMPTPGSDPAARAPALERKLPSNAVTSWVWAPTFHISTVVPTGTVTWARA